MAVLPSFTLEFYPALVQTFPSNILSANPIQKVPPWSIGTASGIKVKTLPTKVLLTVRNHSLVKQLEVTLQRRLLSLSQERPPCLRLHSSQPNTPWHQHH